MLGGIRPTVTAVVAMGAVLGANGLPDLADPKAGPGLAIGRSGLELLRFRVASNQNRTVALTGMLAVSVENELTLGLRRGMWRGQKETNPVKESSFRPR